MVLHLPDSWSNWNLEMFVFEETGKPEYPEKNLSQQRREPTTNSTHIWRRHRDRISVFVLFCKRGVFCYAINGPFSAGNFLLSLLHRTIIPELTFSVKGSPGCKESHFYSLPFGQAVTSMY